MKSILCILLLLLNITTFSQVKTKIVKQVLELAMPTPKDLPGSRGASVVWHPVQKKYYASMAGNAAFPFAIFNATGKMLSDEDAVSLLDVRGLWYNTTTKRIEANGYDETGYFYYTINLNGLITGYDFIKEGMNQPTAQSVGAYNNSKNEILFLNINKVVTYNSVDATLKKPEYPIHFGRTKKQGKMADVDSLLTPIEYNSTTVVYTGIKGAELGFLNVSKKQVELYNANDGFMSQIILLPKNATAEQSFCFAYTNGIFWLFDKEKRKWVGYK